MQIIGRIYLKHMYLPTTTYIYALDLNSYINIEKLRIREMQDELCRSNLFWLSICLSYQQLSYISPMTEHSLFATAPLSQSYILNPHISLNELVWTCGLDKRMKTFCFVLFWNAYKRVTIMEN